MRVARVLATVCAGLAFAPCQAPQWAAAAGRQETYNLRRVYKAGDVDRYRMTMVVVGEGLRVTTDLIVTERVKEVKPDGTATVLTTIESGTMDYNGRVSPFPMNGQTVASTVDRNGRVLKREGAAGALDDALGAASAGLPDRPVRIGEQIRLETPPDDDKSSDRAVVTLTVVGKEKRGGDLSSDAIRVNTSATRRVLTPDGPQSVTITGTAYIECGAGKTLKIEGTVKGVLPPPLGKATITFTRVRIDEAAPRTNR
jgi:hypothetical protein